jgi:hypothetical protein
MTVDPLVPGFVHLVRGFLSAEECDAWIRWSEARGYEEALLSDGSRRADVRNNDRLIFDDPGLAEGWFTTALPGLPSLPYAALVGLNERFRFYRYRPGQRFRHHTDGVHTAANGDFSQFTLLVYLNDDFDGGATEFTRLVVRPEGGAALIFHHQIEHAGAEVLSGVKYVLRTDVMYRLTEEA